MNNQQRFIFALLPCFLVVNLWFGCMKRSESPSPEAKQGKKEPASDPASPQNEQNFERVDFSKSIGQEADQIGVKTSEPKKEVSSAKPDEDQFDLNASKASRKTVVQDVEKAFERVERKMASTITTEDEAEEMSIFGEYLIYLMHILQDLKKEKNKIVLKKQHLKSQAFYDLLKGVQYLLTQGEKPIFDSIEISPTIFTQEINKLSIETMTLGDHEAILEFTLADAQQVTIDDQKAFLRTDKRFGITSAEIAKGIMIPFGLNLYSQGKTGIIKQIHVHRDGFATLSVAGEAATTWTYRIVAEKFFFFFTWFTYKFTTRDPIVNKWLQESIARNKPLSSPMTVTDRENILDSDAKTARFLIEAIDFTLTNGSHLNIRFDYLKTSEIADYQKFYSQVIEGFAQQHNLIDHLNNVAEIHMNAEHSLDINQHPTVANKKITISFKKPFTFKQGEIRVNVKHDVSLSLTEKPDTLMINGVNGFTSVFIIAADLSFDRFYIDQKTNKIGLFVGADVTLPFFKATSNETRWFDLNEPIDVK